MARSQQGARTRWDDAAEGKVTWAELWKVEPDLFLVRAVCGVLPSPSNLHIWGEGETAACPLCSKHGALPKPLGEGRHRWRHDRRIHQCRNRAGDEDSPLKTSHHLRQSRGRTTTFCENISRSTGLCKGLKADGERQLKFTQHIATTTLRPDVVLVSESTKLVSLLE